MINVPPNNRVPPSIRGKLNYCNVQKYSKIEECRTADEFNMKDGIDFDISGRTVEADDSYHFNSPFRTPGNVTGEAALGGCLKVKTQRDSLARISGANMTSSARQHVESAQLPELAPVPEQKAVRFGTVEFREYERRMSDNPSTSAGPPIGIGWRHDPDDTIELDLDLYESDREGSRRTKKELAIPPHVREGMLREVGYSRNDIRLAAKRARKDKERRNASFNQQKFDPLFEKVEVVKHGVKRMMPRRRSNVDNLMQ